MNKFSKLILTTAVFATSGFAATIESQIVNGTFNTPGGSIESDGKVTISSTGVFNNTDTLNLEGEIEDNGTLNLSGKVTGSGKITGTGAINDAELYKTLTGEELPGYDDISNFTTVIGMTDSNESYIASTVDMTGFSGTHKFVSLESKLSTINDSKNLVHLVSSVDSNGTNINIDGTEHKMESVSLTTELKVAFGNKTELEGHAYGLMTTGDGTISSDMSKMENEHVLIGQGDVSITSSNMPTSMIIAGNATFNADTTTGDIRIGTMTTTDGKKAGQFTKDDSEYVFDNTITSHGSMIIPEGKTVTVGTGKTLKIGGTKVTTGTSNSEIQIVKCGYDYPDNMTWTAGTTSDITGIEGTKDNVNHDDIIGMMKLIEATYYDKDGTTTKYSDDPENFDMSKATSRTLSDGIFTYRNSRNYDSSKQEYTTWSNEYRKSTCDCACGGSKWLEIGSTLKGNGSTTGTSGLSGNCDISIVEQTNTYIKYKVANAAAGDREVTIYGNSQTGYYGPGLHNAWTYTLNRYLTSN